MALMYSPLFSATSGSTCSVSAHYAAQHAEGLKARGMTEAQWEQQKHLAQWGVIKGKVEAGNAPELPFAHWKVNDTIQYKIGVKNGKVTAFNPVTKTTIDFAADQLGVFQSSWVEAAAKGDGEWTWLGAHAPKPGPVSLGSKSIGAMSDEDVATMFVKTKDEIATSKGINIKGINKQLDDEVFQAIANVTGYTPKEVNQKVQAYKDSGKKLSSLKKKVVPKKAATIEASPPMSLAEHADSLDWGPPPVTTPAATGVPATTMEVAEYKQATKELFEEGFITEDDLKTLAKSTTNPVKTQAAQELLDEIAAKTVAPLDWDHVMQVKQGLIQSLDQGLIDVSDLQTLADGALSPPTKQAAKELLNDLNKPTHVPHTPPPTAVPTHVAEDAIADAVQQVQAAAPEYLDEDVAKAYIKAKDQIAANPSNEFTLYTQSEAFDSEIYNLMGKAYDINLSPEQIKEQIAKYISEQNKLSVLKKKMAKTGEHTPQADTLKKKKGDPTGIGKTSKTQAQKDIADAAAAGYVPENAPAFVMEANHEQFAFDNLKNSLYAGMQPQAVYEKFEGLASQWHSYFGQASNTPKPSVLDLVRAYDKKKSAQLGIENGFFYEKKAAEYAASPAGQAQILAKQQAEELIKNLPPLPADSHEFPIVPVHEAKARLTPTDWTGPQQRGLTTYTGGAYRPMNGDLRGGRHATSSYYTDIRDAQKGMRPVKEKILVHRGTGFSQFGVNSFEEVLQLVGKTVQDKGFLSTSVGGRGAFSGSVNMEVEVPVGTHGVYVQPISQHKSENEFLIAAGTHYDILGVTKDGYQTTVRVRAVPGSHTKTF